jgi:hypothetical protein
MATTTTLSSVLSPRHAHPLLHPTTRKHTKSPTGASTHSHQHGHAQRVLASPSHAPRLTRLAARSQGELSVRMVFESGSANDIGYHYSFAFRAIKRFMSDMSGLFVDAVCAAAACKG